MREDSLMRRSRLATLVCRALRDRSYRRSAGLACRLEGGAMTSLTLRDLVRARGSELGFYSYGPLLETSPLPPGCEIRRYVSIGPNVSIFRADHPIGRSSLHPFFYNPELGLVDSTNDVERRPLLIEEDCWIGANVVITASCTRIGRGSVIGANSVVTRDVERFSITVGSPARTVRKRFSPDKEAQYLDSRWWELEPRDALIVLTSLDAQEPPST